MFSNSRQLKETKAALIAALGERDEYLRQRDIAVSERNAAVRERDDAIVGKLDRLPASNWRLPSELPIASSGTKLSASSTR
jgi:hypothetical protein